MYRGGVNTGHIENFSVFYFSFAVKTIDSLFQVLHKNKICPHNLNLGGDTLNSLTPLFIFSFFL